MSQPTCCAQCHRRVEISYDCDQRPDEGPWCRDCFEQQPCQTQHDEGRLTQVVEAENWG